jgi:restriction system protein
MNDVPAFHELMWPTVTALKSLGGSATNEELLAKVISIMNLPPEVQAVPHTDGRQSKVNYNLAWAKTYMKKAGLLDNSTRGVWTLTPNGEACDLCRKFGEALRHRLPAAGRSAERLCRGRESSGALPL